MEFKPSVSPTENRSQYMREYRAYYLQKDGVVPKLNQYKRERRYEKQYGLSKEDITLFGKHAICLQKIRQFRDEMGEETWRIMVERLNNYPVNTPNETTDSLSPLVNS
jgi:hypothetical protein